MELFIGLFPKQSYGGNVSFAASDVRDVGAYVGCNCNGTVDLIESAMIWDLTAELFIIQNSKRY